MKKCPRCRVVFHMDERNRCLYCESFLMTVDRDEEKAAAGQGIGGFQAADRLIKIILKEWKLTDHGRSQFLVSSFFQSRTFRFVYNFSRHDYKRGKEYRRFFIQPLSLYSFLMIPWVVYNFFDSLFFRLMYNGYCSKCGWKYIQYTQDQGHSPTECEYNQEYAAVIDNILTGKITQVEAGFKRLASEKMAMGKRSAYIELSAGRNISEWILDVACIWFSILIMVAIIVVMVFPQVAALLHGISGDVELQ